ncbi:UbiA-like protein EboC [Capilliphycus salinus ALCB114379]|uniref:UbiA-like protein EboC n=1 Tax=Capilliphycus salinus TaxID=2768948 RepID=UPI0039A64588
MNTTLLSDRTTGYFQLMRPPNIPTAWADILAGYAISGGSASVSSLLWLLLATTGLYGGGVVFNDVFDAELDAKERPERPIPRGAVSSQEATILGGFLLTVGVVAASQVSVLSLILASLIAAATIIYDSTTKHHALFGPLTMGFCRAGNLLLGISVLPATFNSINFGDFSLFHPTYLAIIPILYIGAITAISQGEVYGGNQQTGWISVGLMAVVIAILFGCAVTSVHLISALLFVGVLSWRIFPPFIQAANDPQPDKIRNAVKAGILSLVVVNATLSACFLGGIFAILVLALLPLSMGLSRLFAMT